MGKFGFAIEAFGTQTELTKKVEQAELSFQGTNPRSSLADTFKAEWDFTVVEQLDHSYDMWLIVQHSIVPSLEHVNKLKQHLSPSQRYSVTVLSLIVTIGLIPLFNRTNRRIYINVIP